MGTTRKFRLQAPVLALAALVASAAALADPVRWTFDQCFFSDGGELSGSFIYDADTDTVSNVNILLTKGLGYLRPDLDPVGPNSLFVSSDDRVGPGQTQGSYLSFVDSASYFHQLNWLVVIPQTTLTDAGGWVDLSTETHVYDPYPVLEPYGELQMSLVKGSIVGVPEPASIAVLLVGLGALGWKMRRLAG